MEGDKYPTAQLTASMQCLMMCEVMHEGLQKNKNASENSVTLSNSMPGVRIFKIITALYGTKQSLKFTSNSVRLRITKGFNTGKSDYSNLSKVTVFKFCFMGYHGSQGSVIMNMTAQFKKSFKN